MSYNVYEEFMKNNDYSDIIEDKQQKDIVVNEQDKNATKIPKTNDFSILTHHFPMQGKFYSGFGPITKNGYGLGYTIKENDIVLSISSKKNALTNVFDFKLSLERSLVDMMILFPKR